MRYIDRCTTQWSLKSMNGDSSSHFIDPFLLCTWWIMKFRKIYQNCTQCYSTLKDRIGQSETEKTTRPSWSCRLEMLQTTVDVCYSGWKFSVHLEQRTQFLLGWIIFQPRMEFCVANWELKQDNDVDVILLDKSEPLCKCQLRASHQATCQKIGIAANYQRTVEFTRADWNHGLKSWAV